MSSRRLLCRKCGYDLSGVVGERCPECGLVQSREVWRPAAKSLQYGLAVTAALAAPSLVIALPQIAAFISASRYLERVAAVLFVLSAIPLLLPIVAAALSTLAIYRILIGRPDPAREFAGWCIGGAWAASGMAWLAMMVVFLLSMS